MIGVARGTGAYIAIDRPDGAGRSLPSTWRLGLGGAVLHVMRTGADPLGPD
jgi:hypothetical protein